MTLRGYVTVGSCPENFPVVLSLYFSLKVGGSAHSTSSLQAERPEFQTIHMADGAAFGVHIISLMI